MTSSIKTFTVTFYVDGEVVKEETVEYGKDATAPEVTKEESRNYSDWVGNYTNVTKDEEVNMTSSVKKFTVTFVDENRTTILGTDIVNYGENATYTGKKPVKAADTMYTYSFKGWDKAFTNITADVTVVAQYYATPVVVIDDNPIPESPVKPSKEPTVNIEDDDTPANLPETGTTSVEVYYTIGGMIMLLGASIIIASKGKKA